MAVGRGYISQAAQRAGLDPRAVLAVASREGLGGGIGDQGTSYGPFQLHKGGAYPGFAPQNPSAAQAWAMSPAGINYALDQIAGVARGQTGRQAIQSIVSRFERPANPAGEIQGALGAYGAPLPSGPSLNQAPYETAGTLRARGSSPLNPHLYRDFAMNLLSGGFHGPQSVESMLGAVMQLRQDLAKQSPVAQSHSGGAAPQFTVSPPQQSPGGFVGQGSEKGMSTAFATSLNQLIKAVGNLSITSGYRSPEEQTSLWNNAVKKYGSAAAARKWVAPPGHSNHNKGLAADLGGNLQLAHQLAPKYGLTFPMPWEPWHIEPMGIR